MAPVGSMATTMRPEVNTSKGPFITVPPSSVIRGAVSSALSTVK